MRLILQGESMRIFWLRITRTETSRTQTIALTHEFIRIWQDKPHQREKTLNTGSMTLKEILMRSAESGASELLRSTIDPKGQHVR